METYETSARQAADKKAIRALVFGIVSLAASGPVGVVFAILAIVQGGGALRLADENGLARDGRAKVGRILGIVGLIAGIAAAVWTVVRLIAIFTALGASIESGSLGFFEEWFRRFGESLSGSMGLLR